MGSVHSHWPIAAQIGQPGIDAAGVVLHSLGGDFVVIQNGGQTRPICAGLAKEYPIAHIAIEDSPQLTVRAPISPKLAIGLIKPDRRQVAKHVQIIDRRLPEQSHRRTSI